MQWMVKLARFLISLGPQTPNPHHMCTRHSLPAAFGFMTLLLLTFASCNSTEGTNVKMPFSGKKYMSDARHFRAVGMGQSANLSVAKSKAELEARKSMAQQVRTNLQVVSDNYASEVTGSTGAETLERFQSLAREVTNTTIGDIRTLRRHPAADAPIACMWPWKSKRKPCSVS